MTTDYIRPEHPTVNEAKQIKDKLEALYHDGDFIVGTVFDTIHPHTGETHTLTISKLVDEFTAIAVDGEGKQFGLIVSSD